MKQHRFGGPWTIRKLEALKAYLSGYAQALKNQPFARIYIDAFAGTGDRADKTLEAATLMEIPELDEITKGSARLALEIDPPFDRYVYIEKRQHRSSMLADLKEAFPSRNIDVLTEDANEAVQDLPRNGLAEKSCGSVSRSVWDAGLLGDARCSSGNEGGRCLDALPDWHRTQSFADEGRRDSCGVAAGA